MIAGNNQNDLVLMPLNDKNQNGNCGVRFESSSEWRWTKRTCSALFRILGQYYNEVWFPTVINEWSELYFRCNYAADYWQRRESWLAGDPEVRAAVLAEIDRHRCRFDKVRQERRLQAERDKCDPGNIDLASVYGTDDNEEAIRIIDMQHIINEAKDQLDLRDLETPDMSCDPDIQMTAEEAQIKAEEETRKAELALANPDEDPDWLEMRPKMRGSLASLQKAMAEVRPELLNMIMIELTRHWAKLPCLDPCDKIEPLLERNILREIKDFRCRLFNAADESEEPEPEQINEPVCPRKRSAQK